MIADQPATAAEQSPAFRRLCTDAPGCPCLAHAERRVSLRSMGNHPRPALDWRGEPLPSGGEW